MPTLDDPSRAPANGPNQNNVNDPFGGNKGANQARITTGGPVQVHAPGFRNAYDLVITTTGNRVGKMYVPDNGPNTGWGDTPAGEGTPNCTNALVGQTQSGSNDALHLVTPGYYGGHPNPTRGNANNTWNGQSPVLSSNPVECEFRASKTNATTALSLLPNSSNGIVEYTADNFGGDLYGDLIIASYQARKIVRISLNSNGSSVTLRDDNLAVYSQPARPLDITTMGPDQAFPGTLWIADLSTNLIRVMEPNDYEGGSTDPTDPTEPTDPTDPTTRDTDGDGILDIHDAFAVDPDNGLSTALPVRITWRSDDPNPGGIADTGFTGLMTNGKTHFQDQFDESNMLVGGASGLFTIGEVPPGDAIRQRNTQLYGFQLGVAPPSTPFAVHGRIVAPFSGLTPTGNQQMGIFIGDGTQDGYVKLTLRGTNGDGEKVHLLREVDGEVLTRRNQDIILPGPDFVDLRLVVDPAAGTVQGHARASTGGHLGPEITLGNPVPIPSSWLTSTSQGLAAGLISTSAGASPFPATWDSFRVESV
jgi:hypothetical protein